MSAFPRVQGSEDVKRVLIINGDKESSRAISSAIARVFEVSRSPSIADAIALLVAGHWYDAIVCAPDLPDGSSEELRARLWANYRPQARRLMTFRGDGVYLLDGDTLGGFFLRRTVAHALICQLDELIEGSAPIAA